MKPPNCKICVVTRIGQTPIYPEKMELVDETQDYSIKRPKLTQVWKCKTCGFKLTTKEPINK